MNIVTINPSVSVVIALNEPVESCFQTLVLEKTLESSLDSKDIKPFNPKGNQPWLLIERTDAVDEAPILCHLMRRSNSFEKTLMMGRIEGRRRRGLQRMRWLDALTNSSDMSLSKLSEIVKDREAWHAAVRGVTKSLTWLRIEEQQYIVCRKPTLNRKTHTNNGWRKKNHANTNQKKAEKKKEKKKKKWKQKYGNVSWYSHCGNIMPVPQKTKNSYLIWSSNPISGHIPRQNCNSKRYMHPYVHSSSIHNSQDMETTYMSIKTNG